MADRALRDRWVDLVAELTALLYRHDPMGIACDGEYADEYEPEAGAIAVRLPDTGSVADVRAVVHAEFVRWSDDESAGPASAHQAIAEEVRQLLDR